MGKVVLTAGFNFQILIVNYVQPLEGRSVASEKEQVKREVTEASR